MHLSLHLGYQINLTIKGHVNSTMGFRLLDGPLAVWDSRSTPLPFQYQYTGTFQVKLIVSETRSKMLLMKHEQFFISYHQSLLNAEPMAGGNTKAGEVHIESSKDQMIYYKQWQFNTSEYLNISLVENDTDFSLRSEYPDHCYLGGFVIKENVTFLLYDMSKPSSSSTYGPYCRKTQGEPLINAINSWILPRGVHHIVVYSYGRKFRMRMTLQVSRTPCEPATNVCIR